MDSVRDKIWVNIGGVYEVHFSIYQKVGHDGDDTDTEALRAGGEMSSPNSWFCLSKILTPSLIMVVNK